MVKADAKKKVKKATMNHIIRGIQDSQESSRGDGRECKKSTSRQVSSQMLYSARASKCRRYKSQSHGVEGGSWAYLAKLLMANHKEVKDRCMWCTNVGASYNMSGDNILQHLESVFMEMDQVHMHQSKCIWQVEDYDLGSISLRNFRKEYLIFLA